MALAFLIVIDYFHANPVSCIQREHRRITSQLKKIENLRVKDQMTSVRCATPKDNFGYLQKSTMYIFTGSVEAKHWAAELCSEIGREIRRHLARHATSASRDEPKAASTRKRILPPATQANL